MNRDNRVTIATDKGKKKNRQDRYQKYFIVTYALGKCKLELILIEWNNETEVKINTKLN